MRIWTRVVLCLLVVAGGARTAYGQGTSDSSREKKLADAALFVTYGTTFVVQMYDAHTTMNALNAGARETNPLLASFSTRSEIVVVAGLARATAIDFAVRSIARRNKAAAIAVGAAVNFSYLVIASHNNAVAFQMRERQAAARR